MTFIMQGMIRKFFSPLLEPIEIDNLLLGLNILASLVAVASAALYKDIVVKIIVAIIPFIISAITYCIIKIFRNV